jgi:peptide/nickel transport system permease protein
MTPEDPGLHEPLERALRPTSILLRGGIRLRVVEDDDRLPVRRRLQGASGVAHERDEQPDDEHDDDEGRAPEEPRPRPRGLGQEPHFESIRTVLAYLVRRVLWAVVLLFCLSLVTYVLFFVLPTDPARFRRGLAVEASDIRQAFNLQGSIVEEYGQFVWNAVAHGSLGRSFATRREVTSMLVQAAPVTGSLILGGAVLFLAMALVVGIVSATRPRSLLDRAGMTFVLVGVSVHPVWIGLVLSYLLGVRLRLTPVAGYCEFFSPPAGSTCGGPYEWTYHMILPWITFAILFSAVYARMIRAGILEAYEEDYVRTARAKGARELRVLRAHVLRNALLPIVTMLGMDVGLAFGGSLFIEQVYGLPGLGRLVVVSLSRRDLPPVVGVVLVVTVAIAVANLLVDLVYAWIDPRVRVAARTQLE